MWFAGLNRQATAAPEAAALYMHLFTYSNAADGYDGQTGSILK